MEGMKDYPDNYFELAIVDPPYGINILSQFRSAGYLETKSMFKQTKGIVNNDWDTNTPNAEYFQELFRVSVNQIIWGGNYFIDYLHSTKCMIAWDKMNGTNNMADFELAWTSFDKRCRRFEMHHFSSGYGDKIHICQKPVKLYKWLLHNYAKEGDKILDTHVGSGSSLIACSQMGFDYVGFEIDKDYYKAAVKRIDNETRQYKMAL